MKKINIFLSFLLLSQIIYAQQGVQNLDFELWTNISGFDIPNGWVVSVPNAKNYTDVQNGSYSIYIETQNVPPFGTHSGFATIGVIQGTTVISGEPWTGGKPSMLNGYFKYNIMNGDTGIIIANFTRWTGDSTKVVGVSTYFVDGSESNWNCISLPISWDATDPNNPDSVTVFLASSANNIQGMNNYGTQTIGSVLQADNLCFDCGCSATYIQKLNTNNIQIILNNNQLQVISNHNKTYQIKLYTIEGKLLKTSSMKNILDISTIASGMYLYLIKNTDNQIVRKDKIYIP